MDERHLLDDTAVRTRWDQLEYSIFNIVEERYTVAADSVYSEHLGVLLGILGDMEPDKWLRTETHRSWLFQAFIWQKLAENVFGEDGFNECARPEGITRLQYQKLKTSVNMTLGPKKELDTARIAALAKEMGETLQRFKSDPDAPRSYPFENLIYKAAQLDADMAKCR
ncbi:hypothetical protein OQA88_7390 [Cercophora sp. LCS_1]